MPTTNIDINKNYIVPGIYLYNIAESIREKTGSTATMTIDTFSNTIANISGIDNFFKNLQNSEFHYQAYNRTSASTSIAYINLTNTKIQITIPDDNCYIISGYGRASGGSIDLGNGMILNSSNSIGKFYITGAEVRAIRNNFSIYSASTSDNYIHDMIMVQATTSTGGQLTIGFEWPGDGRYFTDSGSLTCRVCGPTALTSANFAVIEPTSPT